MSVKRLPVVATAQNHFFASKAEAQAANLGALGAKYIIVWENPDLVLYFPMPGAVDLVGADGSRWQWASIGTPDLLALAGDLAALTTAVQVDGGAITPELTWSGGGGSFSYALASGRWSQIAGRAFIDISVAATMTSLGSGNLQIGGLAVGQRPVAGLFPGYLDIVAKNDAFILPYQTTDIRVSWTGGSQRGVFNYYGSSGFRSVFLSGLAGGTPSGNFQQVSWPGGQGRAVDWQPDPANPAQGRLVLTSITGADPAGTLSGAGWTGTAGLSWGGARSGERFLQATDFAAGQAISFTASGNWAIA